MVTNEEHLMKSMHYYSDVGLPYPDKDQYTTVFVYHKGKVLVDGMAQHAMPPADIALHKAQGHTVELQFDEEAFNAARSAYHARENDKYEEFQRDLLEEHGVTDNPKAVKLFGVCYMRGHATGYSDVASIFADFVDVIRD
jgi:hypothetical protein